MEGIDTHRNSEMRSSLIELKDLASEHRVAILAVMHLNRAVYVVTKDYEDEERRLMVRLKHNLSPEKTGMAYRLKLAGNELPFVEWEDGPVTLTPEEAFSPDDDEEERSLVDNVADWLFVLLN